jgi:hypothetical protein
MFHTFSSSTTARLSKFFFIGDTSWQIFRKQPDTGLMTIQALAGGGGGGGGHTGLAGTQRGGGGGGSNTSFLRCTVAAECFPDLVYILVGRGGLGGAATQAGNAGTATIISLEPDISSPIAIICNLTPGNGGGAGTATVGGAGGVAVTAPLSANMNASIMLITSNLSVGTVGAAGGASGVGTATSFNPNLICGPGAGGGGVTTANVASAGGAITVGDSTLLVIRPNNGGAVSTQGGDGIVWSGYSPFILKTQAGSIRVRAGFCRQIRH